LVWKVKKMVG